MTAKVRKWALSIRPPVNTWHLAITAKVEVWGLSIKPHVSILHLGYHCEGWGMSAIHWTTYQQLAPWLSLQTLGHVHYLQGHLATSAVEWKALSRASDQIVACDDLSREKPPIRLRVRQIRQRGAVWVSFKNLDLYFNDSLISVKI